MSIFRKLLLFSFIILVGNGFIGYSVYQSYQKLLESEQWVQHTEKVIYQSECIYSLNKDVVNALQGFMITSDSTFLIPLNTAEKSTFNSLSQLKVFTQDNPAQQQRIDSLNSYMRECLAFSFQTIELKKDSAWALSVIQKYIQLSKQYSNRISEMIHTIQSDENVLLKQRLKINKSNMAAFNQLAIVLFFLMTTFTVLLLIAISRFLLQNSEKEQRAAELIIANKELLFQNQEKEKRAAELVIANVELLFQNQEKEKRAAELIIANKELAFQNQEKEKRAAELIIANKELAFQNQEKEKRAAELFLANVELIKEEAQKEFERNNLNALINNTNDLMWSVDRYFKLISSNEPFDELIKLSSKNIVEKGDNILTSGFSSEKLQSFKNFYERAFSGENFTEIEHNVGLENTWSEISFHPIRKGNEVIGTACHSRDITQRKNAELKVEEQNTELVKTNSELDRFVYSVSHDLRSPLTSVLGLVSIIDEESKEPETLEYVRMIRISIKRLDQFIKNILNYSKNNRIEIDAEKIPLQKTLKGVVDSLRNMKEAKGIIFEINVEQEADFYTDAQRFDTVMENLIANAIKYRNEKSGSSYVKITGKSDKHSLQITVEDNGVGIPLEYHEKIFDMFYRLSGKIAGSGIGLYIVKEIILKLQGSITVKSEEGKGTSFFVVLKNLTP